MSTYAARYKTGTKEVSSVTTCISINKYVRWMTREVVELQVDERVMAWEMLRVHSWGLMLAGATAPKEEGTREPSVTVGS